MTDASVERLHLPIPDDDDVIEEMSLEDVYKELRFRGETNTGLFRSVTSVSTDCAKGTIAWSNNWAAFMNCMLQLLNLNVDSAGVFVSTRIRKLTIDTKHHFNELHASTGEEKR